MPQRVWEIKQNKSKSTSKDEQISIFLSLHSRKSRPKKKNWQSLYTSPFLYNSYMQRFLFFSFSKEKTFPTTGDLIEHLNSDHGLALKTETQTFHEMEGAGGKNVQILVCKTEGRQENEAS